MTGDPMGRGLIADQLRSSLAAAVGLPATDADSIGMLIDAGELGIALETLCTQIYEYDIEVDGPQRSRLEALGMALSVPVAYLLGDPWAAPPDQKGPR